MKRFATSHSGIATREIRSRNAFRIFGFTLNPCLPAGKAKSYWLVPTRGFTLIELLVVCAIMILVSSILLVSNSRFGGEIQLQNLAYDMALSVRQAQVYGISVRRTATGVYGVGYGVHYNLGSPLTYELFADNVTSDGLYNDGELVVEANSLTSGYYIEQLCSTVGTAENCGLTSLDILFKRPEPDAWISSNGVACPQQAGCSARIVIESPRGDKSSVVISGNGQISVEKL